MYNATSSIITMLRAMCVILQESQKDMLRVVLVNCRVPSAKSVGFFGAHAANQRDYINIDAVAHLLHLMTNSESIWIFISF